MQTATLSRARSRRWLCAALSAVLVLLAVRGAGAGQPAVPAAHAPGDAPAPTAAIAPTEPSAPAPAQPTAPAPAPSVATAPAGDPSNAPTLTPDLPPVPAPTLEAPAMPPPPPRKPFYRKDWFWGAIGVVVLTVGIVLIATSGSDPQAPSTALGNMRAF